MRTNPHLPGGGDGRGRDSPVRHRQQSRADPVRYRRGSLRTLPGITTTTTAPWRGRSRGRRGPLRGARLKIFQLHRLIFYCLIFEFLFLSGFIYSLGINSHMQYITRLRLWMRFCSKGWIEIAIAIPTRMHSSRKRTGRPLTVCRSLLPGGGLLGGVCSRGVVSQHAMRQTFPVNRMTDRCKNITLATTSLRPVIMEHNDNRNRNGVMNRRCEWTIPSKHLRH